MELKWGEVNRWAKNLGYKICKKEEGYFWNKINDESKSGGPGNLFSVVKQIFNDHTDNRWVEHQNNYVGL